MKSQCTRLRTCETPSANSSSDVVAPSLETVTARSLLEVTKAEPVNMSIVGYLNSLTDQSETSILKARAL